MHWIEVTYGFTNRTPDMKLSRGAYKWLLEQMKRESQTPSQNATNLQIDKASKT